jgi:hypothetical protein
MRNRKQTLRLVAVCLVAIGFLSSCGKDNNTSSGRGFRAISEQGSDDGSRTYLDGTAVKWDENDQIGVRNATGETLCFGLGEGANTSYGTFYSDGVNANFFRPNFTAIYPTTSTAGTANTMTSATTATFDLPAVQTYRTNSFGTKAMPMMAYSTDEELEFKNVLGGVVFPLTCSQNDEFNYTVKSVVLTSNNPNDVLWGSCSTTVSGLDGEATLSSTVANNAASKHIITLDCGPDGVELTRGTPIDFIIMVPAGTLESGFTVKVVGDVYWPSAHSSAIGETIYERSVAWSSGQMPDFIVRSRLSKVLTAMDMVPPAYYTVNYIDSDTYEMLAEEKLVWPVTVGMTVTETAIPIMDYMCLAPDEISIVISENQSQNEIIFYYKQYEPD